MSATTQPRTGHANQSAPLGALTILVGLLALGAVGIALGQGFNAAPAAVVPADAQAALHAQRMGEKAPLFPADVQAALYAQRMGEKAPLFSAENPILIQHRGELNDRAKTTGGTNSFGGWNGPRQEARVPSAISGPATGSQKGLDGPKDEGPSESGGWSHSR